jgi:hypothetical protein
MPGQSMEIQNFQQIIPLKGSPLPSISEDRHPRKGMHFRRITRRKSKRPRIICEKFPLFLEYLSQIKTKFENIYRRSSEAYEVLIHEKKNLDPKIPCYSLFKSSSQCSDEQKKGRKVEKVTMYVPYSWVTQNINLCTGSLIKETVTWDFHYLLEF